MLNNFYYFFKQNEKFLIKKNEFFFLKKNCLNKLVTLKVSITGKIYKWSFFKKKINFKINKSNTTQIYNKINVFIISKTRNSRVLLFNKPLKSKRLLFFLNHIRPNNIFTGRGILSGCIVLKKNGKVSTYV